MFYSHCKVCNEGTEQFVDEGYPGRKRPIAIQNGWGHATAMPEVLDKARLKSVAIVCVHAPGSDEGEYKYCNGYGYFSF